MSQQFLNRLKLIGVFCHVVDFGSMREAAAHLGISPAAVSQSMNQLEKELKTTLLYRSTRRISLSEAGDKYYAWGKKMLNAAEQAEEVILQSKSKISGEIRIGVPVGLVARPLAQALTPLFDEHPELKLSVIARDSDIDFIQERVDILVNCGKAPDSNFIYHPLGKNTTVLCASPNYLKRIGCPLSPQELQSYVWLGMNLPQAKEVLSEVSLTHANGESYCFSPKLNYTFNDLNSLISHVQAGYGLALLPWLEVEELIFRSELVALLPDWKTSEFDIYALTANKHYSTKVELALKALKSFFKSST